MEKFNLQGLIRIATYPHRSWYGETKIMFYNELGEQFVLCVDESQHCCEDFEFDCDNYKEDEIISTDGLEITFTYDDEFECECGGAVDIEIKGTEKDYKWRVSNNHNGYYAHTVTLEKETGEYLWEECL